MKFNLLLNITQLESGEHVGWKEAKLSPKHIGPVFSLSYSSGQGFVSTVVYL